MSHQTPRYLNPKALHNQIDKKVLKEMMERDNRPRKTLSFYRYVSIKANQELRDQLYIDLYQREVLGRIYLANEGINAQISVLESRYQEFLQYLSTHNFLKNIPIKEGVENDKISFYKLIVKVRKKIVADGLPDEVIDFSKVGKHITPEEFNEKLDKEDTIVVDVRNHYEYEVGHFDRAQMIESDTFGEQLPKMVDELAGKEEQEILLYCTGGIRCEKASAYLKHHGFKQVHQLHGGIIHYAQEIQKKKLENRFLGKNFVFDHRLGEKISNDIISHCHQCGEKCDTHTNCANDDCHLLFIQCDRCKTKMEGCCTEACREIIHLPIEEQRKRRKGKRDEDSLKVYKSRLRPKLTTPNSQMA